MIEIGPVRHVYYDIMIEIGPVSVRHVCHNRKWDCPPGML